MLDAAIVGAGPYGLSAAAHLSALRGFVCRVFGEPMSFWERSMPHGMLLRSPWSASHLSDPGGRLTLDSFALSRADPLPRPLPLERFVAYGKWFQSRSVPEVERREVLSVHREGEAYRIDLEGGETLRSRRVVVATGIAPFAHRPPQFRDLPAELVTHASSHSDFRPLSGRRVIVIGSGQSALESAALLSEAGSEVEIVARQKTIRFLSRSTLLHNLGLVSRLLYAPADVGPAGVSRIASAPSLYRRLPRGLREAWRKRSIRPAGATWLGPRLRGVRTTIGANVLAAECRGASVLLCLSDGTERRAEHVILATGYRVDLARLPFLSAELLGSIRRLDGFPLLRSGMEASVPGLHFLGAPAALTFGPLMHFVAGVAFAARELSRSARLSLRA